MDCSDCRTHIEDYLDGRLVARHAACARHFEDCPACGRLVAAERRLRDALAKLPVQPPRAQFESRMLRAAVQQAAAPHAAPRLRHYAIAASLLAAVAVAVLMPSMPRMLPQQATVAAAPAPQTVRLVLTAPRALPGAQIRLELPDDSEFAGYEGQHVLEWTADLAKGPNLLEVTINGPGKGIAQATVSYRGSQRTLPLPLEPAAGRTRTKTGTRSPEEISNA